METSKVLRKLIGRINRLFSFDTTRTAQKTTPQTVLRCRGNVFTELLPSNDRGIHRLLRGIYEVRRCDAFRHQDTDTKFHKEWFRRLKVNWMGIDRQRRDRISVILFYKNKENNLKRDVKETIVVGKHHLGELGVEGKLIFRWM
jgi:hypothetical protein